MSIHRRLKSGAVFAMTTLMILPAPAAAPFAWAAPGETIDGTPSREACARYGFRADDDDRAGYYPGRGHMGLALSKPMASSMVAPSIAPPPPPMPPHSPPPSAAMEATVTGSRLARKDLATGYAPPMLPGPSAGSIETERYPDAQINPVKSVAEAPVSTFSTDVDTASYANVRRFLEDGQLPPRDAVRVEELVNYFDYGYPNPQMADTPFKTFVAVTPSPWNNGKQIIHIGLQGYGLTHAEQTPLNLVFLVDVSGSMNPDDRLPLAIKALNVLVDQLRPQDRVSLVVYAGAAGVVLEPTSGREKLKLRCALTSLHAGGSTAGGEGLALAYSMAERHFDKAAANRVILMTDGDFNVGVADPKKLEDFVAAKRKTGIYLSVYGYGRGNYNDLMMQTLSHSGNGTAGYVDSLDEAKKLFREDFTSSLFPIADDVKVQVEFNPARVSEYRLIGYETRLLNREDFNNDRVDAGEVGAGASVTALYEITPTGGAPASDPLRYGEVHPASPTAADQGELAFLKVRYKLPGGSVSRLIERSIAGADVYGRLAQAPESTRFALAVAAYGQRLRGDPWIGGDFGWSDIAALANSARGEDAHGLRGQFVDLVRRAGQARSVND